MAGFDIDLSITRNEIDIAYQPPPAPHAFSVEKHRLRVLSKCSLIRLDFGRPAADPLLLNISGGLYDGYADFRSVWIDERFRQINETSPLYSIAQPRGWNIAAGARWEYMPASGFAQFDIVHQSDIVSPGYEWKIGQGLVRGINSLKTWGLVRLDWKIYSLAFAPCTSSLPSIPRPEKTVLSGFSQLCGWERIGCGDLPASPKKIHLSPLQPLGSLSNMNLMTNGPVSLVGRHYDDTGEIEIWPSSQVHLLWTPTRRREYVGPILAERFDFSCSLPVALR